MPKKTQHGKSTPDRLAVVWAQVLADKQAPTVVEFAKRAGIAPVTLYHIYPEWAEKVRLRRDQALSKRRKLSPVTVKQRRATEVEAMEVVESLRKQLLSTQAELKALQKDRDRWQREAADAEKLRSDNERLRGTIQRFGDTVKKHVEARKAQAILDEATRGTLRQAAEPIPMSRWRDDHGGPATP